MKYDSEKPSVMVLALLIVMMCLLTILALTSKCSTGEQVHAVVTQTPTPNPILSVGSTLRDVREAIYIWKDFSESHPTCGPIITKNCIPQETRDRVAKALRDYADTRKEGPKHSLDTSQDSEESIRASAVLVEVITEAVKKQ